MHYDLMRMMILLTGFIIALQVNSLLRLLIDAVIAPLFCMRVSTFSLFGLTFLKNDGRWKSSFTKLSPIIQHQVVFNMKKPAEKLNEKNSNAMSIISKLLLLAVDIGICTAILLFFRHRENNYLRALANGFAMGIVFFGLQTLAITIYTMTVLRKRLTGYMSDKMQNLRNGMPLRDLDLKPVDELGFKKVTKTERIFYYGAYMAYLAATDNYGAMHAPSHEVMNYMVEREYIHQETLTYYWLLFFFSEVEPNTQLADSIYNKIKGVITTDTDANAKRLMAYYAFNIYHDVAGAERFVTEGYAALGRMTGILSSEGELEKKLLDRINARITQEKAYPNTQFPDSENRIM